MGLMIGLGALGSAAWACTAQVGIDPLPVQSGHAGTKMAVTGESVKGGPVEIRWNGVKGQVVATAIADKGGHGTQFTTEVVIPDAPPGVHYLVLAAGETGVGRAAFEVTSPAAATSGRPISPTADAWSAGPSSASTSTSSQTSPALTLGMTVFAVGLVTLFAGATAGAVRRTRVTVRSNDRR